MDVEGNRDNFPSKRMHFILNALSRSIFEPNLLQMAAVQASYLHKENVA